MKKRHLLPLIVAASFGSFGLLSAEVPAEQLKKIFDPELTSAGLEKIIAETGKDLPQQIKAEAKLVWGLRNQDTEFLTKLLPELEAAAPTFKKDESASMQDESEFKGLISYIKALDAKSKGNEADFKAYITEAFWLTPQQAQMFAQPITQFRTEQKMANLTVDMKQPITTSKGEASTLTAQLGKNKAILIDFWASWCGPCMQLMPELAKKAESLGKQGIAVVAMNTESEEATAEKVRVEKKMELPWLVEPQGQPFSGPLDISSIPRMVLLSPEGKVLYNGHPQDPALWAALKKVDASIEAPKE